MKKCQQCETVSAAPQESEIESIVCRFCGSLDFVDVSEDELRQIMQGLTRRERCCPNPACEPRLLTNEDNFCSRCGTAAKKTSLNLWIQKCVEPDFIANPVRLYTDTKLFIEAARKMGFPSERSNAKLEEMIQQWTGQPFKVAADWISRIREMLDSFLSNYYAGRRSSKKLYKNARAGKTVVGFVLSIRETNGAKKTDNGQITFTKHFNGKFIGFYNKANRKELWIYPIPNLKFSESDFNAVFPSLTEESYKTGGFEPEKAILVGSGNPKIWSLSSITESQKQLIPALTALADEKGLDKEFTGKILKSFFP